MKNVVWGGGGVKGNCQIETTKGQTNPGCGKKKKKNTGRGGKPIRAHAWHRKGADKRLEKKGRITECSCEGEKKKLWKGEGQNFVK